MEARKVEPTLSFTNETPARLYGVPLDCRVQVAPMGVSFADANTGTAVGARGTVLHTDNGGATWTRQNSRTNTDLWGVSFVDAQTGTMVGGYGSILRTTTGGGLSAE